MQTTVQQSPATTPKPAPQITLETFKRRYLEREDKYKYEWVRGEVIKTQRNMNQAQQFIWLNFKYFLERLRSKDPQLGEFLVECDSSFAGAFRRPDIAYFTKKQLPKLVAESEVPAFVIEVVSNNDQLNNANLKLADYRRAGVEIVWFVFPKTKEIHVHRGKQMTICLENDPCSAEPVIDGFVMQAADVFKKTS